MWKGWKRLRAPVPRTRLIRSRYWFFVCHIFCAFTVGVCVNLRLSGSMKDVSGSVRLTACLARPHFSLFVVGRIRLLPCALILASISRYEVLWDVLDRFPCVFVWCVTIPTHPILCSSIMLPVTDRPTVCIFSRCDIGTSWAAAHTFLCSGLHQD